MQRPYDSLPPGVTTSAPTPSTSSSVAPTTIGKFVFISIRIEQKTKKIIVTTSLLEVLEKVRFYGPFWICLGFPFLINISHYSNIYRQGLVLSFFFWLSISGNIGNDCNFDVGICKWTFASYGQFNWTRHQGSTASSGTGPKYDHTRGNSGISSSPV